MKIRFIAFISALLLVVSLFSACGKTPFGKDNTAVFDPVEGEGTLLPISAEENDLLFDNPDRGWRTELVIWCRKTNAGENNPRAVYVDQSEEEIRKRIEFIFDIYFKKQEPTKLALSYIYITDWRGEELSEDLMRFFDIYFTMCRERKIKNMLRVSYCDSHDELDRGADERTIVRHVKQLAPVISEFADTIHTIECGFVGSYGEWAEVYQYPPVDYATVIKAITENLAVPNDLYFSIRDPKYKNTVGKDYEHYWSIAYNCDAMHGYNDRGWCSDEYLPGTARWAQVENEGAYTPQGGEMFTNLALFNNETIPIGWEMILQCYYHRHTSMSYWHGYLEAPGQDNVMTRWKSETLTAAKLDSKGIIHDPAWFIKEDGTETNGNPYEFIRDHLGYRLSAEKASVSWSGRSADKIKASMTFKNYGFAAAFNMTSSLAVLDSEGKVVAEQVAGDPKTWYNRDPDDAYSAVPLTHTVSAELDGIKEKGTYKLAFRLYNTMGTTARLANKLDYENGYNILYTFEVK